MPLSGSTDAESGEDAHPSLSKSRFQYGLQCLKRLYLETKHRELADSVDAALQARFDTGTAVGELAQRHFPGGTLITESYLAHASAVTRTQKLLSDFLVPALYEAAFTHQGIRTRVDVLARNPAGGFDLIEVKSTTSLKNEHITDVAIQMYAVEGSGVPIANAYLMHLNNAYVYEGGDHDLEQLFTLEDVTEEARAFIADSVPTELERMWAALRADEMPDIATGPHCLRPYRCSFFDYCHADEPANPIRELPGRLDPHLEERLNAAGIATIGNIPSDGVADALLTHMQRRVRDSVASSEPFVGPDLGSALSEIEFPISFLDFEAVGHAVPVYVGTRPYQAVPFQWSLYVREESGELRHTEFLNDDADDPRERLITALLEVMPPTGSIVAYSPYEKTTIERLARDFPHYAEPLNALAGRIVDMLQIVRQHYYHPAFHGSFSIKSVLPALAPDLTYADLAINEGTLAAVSYQRMISAETPADERTNLRADLLTYCDRDTEAMIRVYDALRQAATQE